MSGSTIIWIFGAVIALFVIYQLTLSKKDKLLQKGYLIDNEGLAHDIATTRRKKTTEEELLLGLSDIYREALKLERRTATVEQYEALDKTIKDFVLTHYDYGRYLQKFYKETLARDNSKSETEKKAQMKRLLGGSLNSAQLDAYARTIDSPLSRSVIGFVEHTVKLNELLGGNLRMKNDPQLNQAMEAATGGKYDNTPDIQYAKRAQRSFAREIIDLSPTYPSR